MDFLVTLTLQDLFWTQVDRSGECWIWTGLLYSDGYGRFHYGRKIDQRAHRVAYELEVGPIPDGLVIDHVAARGCTSKACVRPNHLEPVTVQENILRSNSASAVNARKTHCPEGHEYIGRNVLISNNRRIVPRMS